VAEPGIKSAEPGITGIVGDASAEHVQLPQENRKQTDLSPLSKIH